MITSSKENKTNDIMDEKRFRELIREEFGYPEWFIDNLVRNKPDRIKWEDLAIETIRKTAEGFKSIVDDLNKLP